jgi:lipopolysaccharide biosynthesis glycosyltransferase
LPNHVTNQHKQDICIALASDQFYYPGLVVSACTAALHCDKSRNLQIHIFDGGIQSGTWQSLKETLQRFHPSLSLHRHPLEGSSIFEVRDHGPGRELVYARLLIPKHIAASRVLYLDVDLLILADLSPLVDLPLGSNLAAACIDPIVRRLGADRPWPDAPTDDPDGAYFNSGVMLIDCEGWRREHISEQAFSLLAAHGLTCRFRDQTVLNHLLAGRWLQLDSTWNTISRDLCWSAEWGIQPNPLPRVLHFFDTAKPWATCLQPQLAHRLWQRQARRIAGIELLRQLPPLTQRQLLRAIVIEHVTPTGWQRRRAMTKLLRG